MKYDGLNEKEAALSREKYGSNAIPESQPATFWGAFKETFQDPMIQILLIISGLMIVMFFFGYAQIYEAAGTITAIIIVSVISAKTEVSSDTAYRKLKNSQKKISCKVFRSGRMVLIDMDDVVVGDKVLLQPGDMIPADGILCEGLITVDNSSLNGETEECRKSEVPVDTPFADNITGDVLIDSCSLFRGTMVFSGEGILDVRKVGLSTMMGKMAEDMGDEEVDSPLKVKLKKLAGQIAVFGYIGAAAAALLYMCYFVLQAGGLQPYLAQGAAAVIKDVVEALSLSVVIVVCAVPEGLPLMISLVLMRNTKSMLDHNVLVRKAVGIETAGSMNILFSDKTGTITKGKLEVVSFFTADGEVIPFAELKNSPLKEQLDLSIGMNSASLFNEDHRVIGGNITDQALLRFIGEETYRSLQESDISRQRKSQAFNSTNKFSQAELPALKKTFYKGAPDRFFACAKKCMGKDGQIKDIDPAVLTAKVGEMNDKSMRVLAFGYSESEMQEDRINADVVLIGLAAIRDDVRPEAKEAIAEVRDAGIQVVMITGDALKTASAIARDAGLMRSPEDIALTSAQMGEMSDEELKKRMPRIRVIARALPTDKSRMVRICQEMNLVVGMTGDGVNDSPALKRADVGFAMGSGTEAAKEAGDIVVLDDNFRSIKDAVLYGRTIYSNILKFCRFQLVINVAAVFVSALSPLMGIEEPLKVTHLLFVNLVMDGFGAMMLGGEPAFEKYMKEKPRRRDESLISGKMMGQILTMGLWLILISFVFLKSSFVHSLFADESQLYTAYFGFFILAALFNGFNVRSEGFGILDGLPENPDFMKIWGLIALILILIINAALIPLRFFGYIGKMFACTPFGLKGWVMVVLCAFTMIPVDLLRKAVTNRKK